MISGNTFWPLEKVIKWDYFQVVFKHCELRLLFSKYRNSEVSTWTIYGIAKLLSYLKPISIFLLFSLYKVFWKMQILNFDSHRCRALALSLRTQASGEFINVQISNAFIFPCLEQILNVVLSNFTPKGEQMVFTFNKVS